MKRDQQFEREDAKNDEGDDVAVDSLRDELQIQNRYLTAIDQVRELGEDLAAELIPGKAENEYLNGTGGHVCSFVFGDVITDIRLLDRTHRPDRPCADSKDRRDRRVAPG
mgnify:FL=1